MNYHKVYVPHDLSPDEMNKLLAALDENSQLELKKLSVERYDVESLIDTLEVYVIISKQPSSRNGKILFVNPFDVSNFLFSVSTYLATENYRDKGIYAKITNHFKKNNHLNNMNVSMEGWSGGGSTIGDELKNSSVLKNNFVLVVVDSDKKASNDKIGGTAKGVKFLSHNRFNADYYIPVKVMEVENLIPYKIIQEINNEEAHLKSFDWSYFDLKNGLKLSILHDSNVRKYWKQNLENYEGKTIDWDVVDKMIKDKDSDSSTCGALIPGIGRKLLDSALTSNQWQTIENSDLTDAQLEEWNIMGKLIFSWTCCSNKRV